MGQIKKIEIINNNNWVPYMNQNGEIDSVSLCHMGAGVPLGMWFHSNHILPPSQPMWVLQWFCSTQYCNSLQDLRFFLFDYELLWVWIMQHDPFKTQSRQSFSLQCPSCWRSTFCQVSPQFELCPVKLPQLNEHVNRLCMCPSLPDVSPPLLPRSLRTTNNKYPS